MSWGHHHLDPSFLVVGAVVSGVTWVFRRVLWDFVRGWFR